MSATTPEVDKQQQLPEKGVQDHLSSITGEFSSPKSSPRPLPPGPQERLLYYHGLPSRAPLVARSSTFIWEERHDPESGKMLSPAGRHPIADKIDELAPEVRSILDSEKVNWTRIDVVRIGYEGEKRPVILWIGVRPSSLSGEDGVRAALACKGLLVKYGINDVECEIRESERISL